jgi:hypothetical protein
MRRLLLALRVCTLPLFVAPSVRAAPSYVAYVGCSASADAAPAHVCKLGDRLGAFFETTDHIEVQFQTCISFSSQQPTCIKEQPATALTPLVFHFTPRLLGSYFVSWRVNGHEVASWPVETAVERSVLTPAIASEAFKAKILADSPGARFPRAGSPLCPKAYPGHSDPRSVCFAEYRTGRLWHLLGYGASGKGDQIGLHFRAEARWFRKWVHCSLGQAPGVLTSNNDCGYHQPQNDEDLLLGQVLSNLNSEHPLRPVRWTFAESTGFPSIGIYRAKKAGRSYVFTNAIGDSFRYRP